MTADRYTYTFPAATSPDEVAATLLLAVTAAEGLYGPARVRLDAGYVLDPVAPSCVIAAATPVGRALNRLFAGFLAREFGPAAFTVERSAPGRIPATT